MDTSTPAEATPEQVARRFLDVLGSPESTSADLAPLLHPDVEFVEHPNRLRPEGGRRGREETLAALDAASGLLARQELRVHDLVAAGDTVAVRATWTGELAVGFGPLVPGAVLSAEVAQFVTVRDGLVVRHETFDCYHPLPTA